MRRLLLLVSTLSLWAVACGGPKPPEVAMSTDPLSGPDAGAVRPASDGHGKKSDPPPPADNRMRCGCALCDPVVSDDACASDADCGPSQPCHADKCVGIAKARPATPTDRCTMILMCNTVDANACGCLAGKCALYPRKK